MYSYPPTLKPDSLWMVHFDPAGNCTYASKSFIHDFGNEAFSDVPDVFRAALHSDEHSLLCQQMDACKRQPGTLIVSTFRLTNSKGIRVLTEWKMSLLEEATGKPLIYAVGVDKVDNFLVSLVPNKLQALTKLFFDATPVVQLCIGEGGKVLFFNQRAIQFVKSRTGVIPCIGEPLRGSLFAGFSDRLQHKVSEGWGGKSARFEEKCVHAGGREDWYKIEVTPFVWGGERGVSLSLINVTTTREAQQRAVASEEQIHNSTYAISHHLRAHLSNVVGISAMMEDMLSENRWEGDLPALVEMIREEAGKLDKAVRRVEEFLFSGD